MKLARRECNNNEVCSMQVTETLSEGLKREFKVVVPAAELDAKVNVRLDEMKDRVRMNGFRPGKVPVAHLKRMYGRSAMAEVIEATVRDTNNQIVSERGFKLASDPKVTLPTEQAAVEKLIAGESDLDYTMAVEIVPNIELANFKDLKLTKLTSDVADSEIDESIARIAEQNKPYTPKAEGGKAAKDDRVTISYAGTIDGVAFEGGTGDNAEVLIGSNTFIPGFEDQLVGIGAGETRTLKVTFPAAYGKKELADKNAEFVRDEAKRQYVLRFSLNRLVRPEEQIAGQLAIIVDGERNASAASVDLGVLTGGKASLLPFNFRYFASVEQPITLPADFRPQRVTVEVRPGSKGVAPYRQTFVWTVEGH